MTTCFFVSDLHGKPDRYQKLLDAIAIERPNVVFLGGDLLPHGILSQAEHGAAHWNFINDFLVIDFTALRKRLADACPRVFLILGNDDARFEETAILNAAQNGVWEYAHNRKIPLGKFSVYGYSCVPPTPFQIKDWERYDVSQSVKPGCILPEKGLHTVSFSFNEIKHATIEKDLKQLVGNDHFEQSIFLFHTPPYNTNLDRVLNAHVGSVAVRQFIETRQPMVTLHGHIHESARLTGSWKEKIDKTFAFSAAHDGPELALVRFELENPQNATRELL